MVTAHPISAAMRRIQREDKRIRFSQRFPIPLMMDDINHLTPHLEKIPAAISSVEKTFLEKHQIQSPVQAIEIDAERRVTWARYGVCPPSVSLTLGKSEEYAAYFQELQGTLAHEIGHILSAINPDGTIRYSEDNQPHYISRDVKYLRQRGAIPYKYFKGVDQNLFRFALMENNYSCRRLHYFLNELIANRVAEITVGKEEEKTRIGNQVKEEVKRLQRSIEKSLNPFMFESDLWAYLFDLVMADIHSFSEESNFLATTLEGIRLPWESYIPTTELRLRMITFYREIEIINQVALST